MSGENKTSEAVTRIYDACTKIIEAKDKATAEDSYKYLLSCSKSNEANVKMLLAQSIPRFVASYPSQISGALEAQIDLCEDDDLQTRVVAIRGLPLISKAEPKGEGESKVVVRVTDVLAQLLIAEDPLELKAVKTSYSAMFSLGRAQSFGSLLNQIQLATDEKVREGSLAYFREEFKEQQQAIRADEKTQQAIAAGIKKILESDSGVTGAEFQQLLGTMSRLPVVQKDAEFHKEIARIIAAQAGLAKEFEPSSEEAVAAFVSCAKLGKSQKGFDFTPFLEYFFGKVLAKWDAVGEKQRLQLLQAVAPATRSVTKEQAKALFDPLLQLVRKNVPKASEVKKPAAAAEGETKDDGKAAAAAAADAPKINFSHVEAYLFMIHQIGFKNPDIGRMLVGAHIYTGQPLDAREKQNLEVKEDFLARLQYLDTNVKNYTEQVKKVKANIVPLLKVEGKTEDEKKLLKEKLSSCNLALRVVNDLARYVGALTGKEPEFLGPKAQFSADDRKPLNNKGGKQGSGKGQQGQKRKRSEKSDADGAARPGKKAKKEGGGQNNNGGAGGRGGQRGGRGRGGQRGGGGRGRGGRGRGGRGRGNKA